MTIFKTHLTHQSPIVPALPKPKDSLRLLHTSDWHLGKLLYNQSRYDEFAKFLDWLIEALILHQVDILIIAGDIFDTMTPSNRAEYLYHHFLASAFKNHIQHIIIVAGNHDSPTSLQKTKEVLGVLNTHVIGSVSQDKSDELIVLTPFVQILKPISPLAWMPIALYTIKDSNASSIFVIFICSIWPMLTNTAFGVASVRREWRNVAKTLELSPLKTATKIVIPAAAPTIVTGMRISMGIAWLVIVAAEMLVGGTGIGYFVWNQWNNLSLANVIFAVLLIGLMGMILDMLFAILQKKVSYVE